MVSSLLQAKKAARDAKRKKLEAMFTKHKESESSTTTTTTEEESVAFALPPSTNTTTAGGQSSGEQPPNYASYQHATPDPEQGGGHVVHLGGSASHAEKGALLREQAQALIHNEPLSVASGGDTAFLSSSSSPAGLLARIRETIEENPKTSLNAFLVFAMMYWWL